MPANPHPEAAPCGPAGAADWGNAAPLRRNGLPVWHGVARTLAAIGLTLALSACAIPRRIDSEVQSFVGTPAAVVGATYRFERLPSQQAQTQDQDRMEALTQTALQRIGLSPAAAQPRYYVQVQTEVVQFQPVSTRVAHPMPPYVRADGVPLYSPLLFLAQPPWYGHSVHLVLRDTASGQVVYETKARFDGPWSDSFTLWPAILEAALRGYPHPTEGVRKVTIELPPGSTPAP